MNTGIIFAVLDSHVKIYSQKNGFLLAHKASNNLSSLRLYDIVSYEIGNYNNKRVAINVSRCKDKQELERKDKIIEVFDKFADLDEYVIYSLELVITKGVDILSKDLGLKPLGTISINKEVKFLFKKI